MENQLAFVANRGGFTGCRNLVAIVGAMLSSPTPADISQNPDDLGFIAHFGRNRVHFGALEASFLT
jgi:hypothetical protein